MTVTSRLASAGLSLPDYGGKELGAVIPAALAAVGLGAIVPGRLAEADRLRLSVPESRHVVVVLIDGLGKHQLEARKGHAPFLRSAVNDTITAGFPTTTAASLALLGTGQPSGRTGMTGYTVRNPETGGLANLVSWQGAPEPSRWQPMPSLLDLADRAGLKVLSLGKAAFAGSGLTQAALRGGQFVGADRLSDRVDIAAQAAKAPGITYCYWGELDAVGHKFGWQSGEWVAALEEADSQLRRLAAALPRGATMLLTADHGMVDVLGEKRWDVAAVPDLSRDVEIVAGEPRASHVHLTDGVAVDDAARRWQEVLGGFAVVLTRDEIIGTGLMGSVADAHKERIGDLVVIMTGKASLVDSRTQTPQSLNLVGMHGSLTREELEVPLALATGR